MTTPRSIRVADESHVPAGTMLLVRVDREPVLLVNLEGQIHAMQGVCAHEENKLDQGHVLGDSIVCSLHGSRFSLITGEAINGPAELPLERYLVRVQDGGIWLDLGPEGIKVNSDLR
jgi:3-phenylpropionate/trans-cinnamate dioxygenase ferredoxin subunit